MAEKKAVITVTQARGAARRLSRTQDFQTLEKYLAKKAGAGRSPFVAGEPYDTHRRIGRQEQHQLLVNLVNGKTGGEDE